MKKNTFITFFIMITVSTHAMNNYESAPLSKEEITRQDCYNQWQKVTQTSEFIHCIKLLKKKPPSPRYTNALKDLYATREFKKYSNLVEK